MITSIKYILSILSNIYYIMIFIVYIKQRCTLSIKKGLILLMILTSFTLNILYLFVFYDLIKQRNVNPDMAAPSYCIIITALKSSLILVNIFHFSFIFLYTYMGLYHSEFLVRNKKKFCFIYLGLTWAIGIFLCLHSCFDKEMTVLNTGDCKPSSTLFNYLYVIVSLILVLVLIFSLVKVYFTLRRNEEADDESKVYTKKLFILGIIIFLIIFLSFIIYPLSFIIKEVLIMTSIRVAMQIGFSFAFVLFYSYDEEFGKIMKEVFLCKKNNIPLNHDTIYEVIFFKD